MIRDTLRAGLVLVVLAVAASLLVETRYRLAAIDVAHRQAVATPAHAYAAPMPAPPQPQPGRLHALGRAALELADAAIGVVR